MSSKKDSVNGTKDFTSKPHPYILGENYFIRFVTHHYVGKLVEIYDDELVLTKCSWIASDGRFADVMATGNFDEVEPYPPHKRIIIGRGGIADAHATDFPLPTEQK